MSFYDEEIKKLVEKDNFRQVHNIEYKTGKYLSIDGRNLLNFSSNDYLNISTDRDLLNEFIEKYKNHEEFILSSTSSRLLTGTSTVYKKLENNLAKIFNKEACLIFNTGYQCNLGVVSSLVNRDDVIFSDKLNHASIIDGMRLSSTQFFRYKHFDYNNLEELLIKHRNEYKKAIIISESVFSMDGDIADIKKLIELKKKYNCLLMIDEAHAFGIYGKNLAGIADRDNLLNDVDIITATLGKSFASMGAFCVSNRTIIDYLINKANSFIFSTAIPPVNIMWSNFLIEEKFNTVRQKAEKLNTLIKEAHNYIKDNGETQIVPVIIGENNKTVKIAEQLRAKGFYVLPVRPPTVPVNTSRLRLSLTADITFDEFKTVIDTVKEVL
ncbi:TPA: pyridoxal phosphate-dependent aminotransferase family protein [Candidatus Avigastranaerophilus faecigallinarum]|nr:pyridoxal phosphate-dependent aminotransferase family protein [Candidatus Avigastranaerophilus faecigallinarum]